MLMVLSSKIWLKITRFEGIFACDSKYYCGQHVLV